jgi:hypothetical protein
MKPVLVMYGIAHVAKRMKAHSMNSEYEWQYLSHRNKHHDYSYCILLL